MDYNPDTINHLIGAKVASYKSLPEISTKDKEIKLADAKLKKDIHLNESPYKDIENSPEAEARSKRSLRVEEAYAFLSNEIDDIYDDAENNDSDSDEDENSEDTYSNEYMEGLKESVGNIAQGGPSKKFYQTKDWHKKNKSKWRDQRRRELVGNAAAIVGESKGYDPKQAKEAALLGDAVAAPLIKKGAKVVSGTAGRIMNSVRN
jgi:hypothetical protein